jgi:hypothetical protein
VTPPLVRFAFPLLRHSQCASTPGSKLPSAARCQARRSFRPRGFSPPRRFAPHAGSRACCIPLPDRGSPRFQPTQTRAGPEGRRWTTVPSPRRGSHPSKSFPRRQPLPHHCGPLPSCRYWTTRQSRAAEAALDNRSRPRPGAGSATLSEEGEGSRRGPFAREDDAPIRRSGPPRHLCPCGRQPRSTTARTCTDCTAPAPKRGCGGGRSGCKRRGNPPQGAKR